MFEIGDAIGFRRDQTSREEIGRVVARSFFISTYDVETRDGERVNGVRHIWKARD